MLWHFVEVWLLLAGGFLAGCVIGTAAHSFVANSRAAGLQEDLGLAIAAWLPATGRPVRAAVEDDENLRQRNLWDEPEEAKPQSTFVSGPNRRAASETTSGAGSLPPEAAAVDPPVADLAAEAGLPAAVPPPELAAQPTVHATAPEPASAEEEPTRPDDGPPAGRAVPADADRLVRINGLGKRSAEKLNANGIYRFSQIAAWTPDDVERFSAVLGPGVRPKHDDWIGQAARLAAEKAGPGAG